MTQSGIQTAYECVRLWGIYTSCGHVMMGSHSASVVARVLSVVLPSAGFIELAPLIWNLASVSHPTTSPGFSVSSTGVGSPWIWMRYMSKSCRGRTAVVETPKNMAPFDACMMLICRPCRYLGGLSQPGKKVADSRS